MYEPIEFFPLKHLNTFGMDVWARYYVKVERNIDLLALLEGRRFDQEQHIVIGGGSNVLFTRDFAGWVIHMATSNIAVVRQDEQYVWLTIDAGVAWHDLVLYCVEKNYGGIENLSFIPGTVGAAPMQNIGAYGVEISDCIDTVHALNIKEGTIRPFNKQECGFGYRESVFKNILRGKYIITQVTLRLKKNPTDFQLAYGAIRDVLAEMNITQPSVKAVSDAVTKIRQGKLPDPAVEGNAGSFFKNPVIDYQHLHKLQRHSPDVPSYKQPNGQVKLPAGWLIERCGWKGKRRAQIGVHPQHALVLVNYDQGTGAEICQLMQDIQQSVQERFEIALVPEVQIIT
ncbi:MAG: UDP-N-acetylmuramate dehydrogenase [Bacteroidota bacterium]